MFPTVPGYPNADQYGQGTDYYQIKPDDTYDSIAQQTGVNAADLQGLNGVVPPPKGSFIRLPTRLNPLGEVGGGARGGNRAGAPGDMGNPALAGPNKREQAYGAAAQNNSTVASYYTQAALPPGTQGVSVTTPVPGTAGYVAPTAPAAYSASYADPAQLAQALATGNFPSVLSVSAANKVTNPATGQPYTPQDYAAAGYTYNAATGQYLRNGATGTATNTPATSAAAGPGTPGWTGNSAYANTQAAQYYAANNVPFYAQKRWVKGRGFVTLGQLIREGSLDIRTGKMRQKKGGGGGGDEQQQASTAPAEATNAGTSPSRIYRSNQGGG